MRHGGAHSDVGVEIFVVQPVDDLVHERRNLVGVGAGVGRGSAGWACDVDRAGAPESGGAVALKYAGVEVQIEDDAVQPAEVRVDGHRADVVHRARVAGQRCAVSVVRLWNLFAGDDPRALTGGHVEPLDRDGTLHRARSHLAA